MNRDKLALAVHTNLRMTERQHAALEAHLFPGDGLEAVALVLCGHTSYGHINTLTVHRIAPVPYSSCKERRVDRITWSTDMLPDLLEEATRRGLSLLKIHSHPTGFDRFSQTDDASDRELFPAIYTWVDSDAPHGSAIMLPNGRIFGRIVSSNGVFRPIQRTSVAGTEIRIWDDKSQSFSDVDTEDRLRTAQAFGRGTTNLLRRLRVAVIGCSGTGSLVIEALARLGVGELILVDPDHVEEKNLNRIVNSTREDAIAQRAKVDVLAEAIHRMGFGTHVSPIRSSLFAADVVREVATADVVIGCMDTVDGRDLLNRITAFYLIPYIDVGVGLIADGQGGIDQICGTVHYLQPDGSSLLSRGLYTPRQLRAAGMRRTDPTGYAAEVKEKYIVGANEDRPAVISVNMIYAALAVNELLARLHPYRDDGNTAFAAFALSLTQGRLINEDDGAPCQMLTRDVGRGDVRPLLNMPELSER